MSWIAHTAAPDIYHDVIQPVGRGLQVAYHSGEWLTAVRSLQSSLSAGAYLEERCCVGAMEPPLPSSYRCHERTRAYGFSRSLTGNAADIASSLLMGLPMAGAAATATEGMAADGFDICLLKLPAASTNIFTGLAILPDAVQSVAGFLPGHDPASSTATHWD